MKPDLLQRGTSGIGVALFVASVAIGGAITAILRNPAGVMAGALAGLYFIFAIKVADQWEKVAVLRFGRYIGLRGPGIFHIIPIVDQLSRVVDQRVRVANVSAESTLTRDTVPVDVDAIVFWMVWNPEKSILEVQDFDMAITMSAQTALRESIGRHELHQMVAEREMLGHELQRILDAKTNPWGITVQSVEIRDVQIPSALQDAMSREAQAERERRARTILGLAETEISDSFAKAAATYRDNPVALHLRASAPRIPARLATDRSGSESQPLPPGLPPPGWPAPAERIACHSLHPPTSTPPGAPERFAPRPSPASARSPPGRTGAIPTRAWARRRKDLRAPPRPR